MTVEWTVNIYHYKCPKCHWLNLIFLKTKIPFYLFLHPELFVLIWKLLIQSSSIINWWSPSWNFGVKEEQEYFWLITIIQEYFCTYIMRQYKNLILFLMKISKRNTRRIWKTTLRCDWRGKKVVHQKWWTWCCLGIIHTIVEGTWREEDHPRALPLW